MNPLSRLPTVTFHHIQSHAQSSALGNTCRDLRAKCQAPGAVQAIVQQLNASGVFNMRANTATQEDLKTLNANLMSYYTFKGFQLKDIPGAGLGIRAVRFLAMRTGIRCRMSKPLTSTETILSEINTTGKTADRLHLKYSFYAPLLMGPFLGHTYLGMAAISIIFGAVGIVVPLATSLDSRRRRIYGDEEWLRFLASSAIAGSITGLAIGAITGNPIGGLALGAATSLPATRIMSGTISLCLGVTVGLAKAAWNSCFRR